jgi:hypothetical protein
VTLAAAAGVAVYQTSRDREAARADLAEADRLWAAGDPRAAADRYRAALRRAAPGVPPAAELPRVYLRVAEADLGRGDGAAARAAVGEALDRGVDLSAAGKGAVGEVVAEVRAGREQRAAEEQARREAEARRRQEERAPRHAVEVVAVRLEPFRTTTGATTTMVHVDWRNTGNRPVRWVTARIRGYAASGREVDGAFLQEHVVYSVFDDAPGVAPGGTYVTPAGRGRLVPPGLDGEVARVTVQVLAVREEGPPEAWR